MYDVETHTNAGAYLYAVKGTGYRILGTATAPVQADEKVRGVKHVLSSYTMLRHGIRYALENEFQDYLLRQTLVRGYSEKLGRCEAPDNCHVNPTKMDADSEEKRLRTRSKGSRVPVEPVAQELR
ncbi:hypothetical protein scyTo_0001854 [Scyliorhinus torazame]|uniref:Uncharacterized protein n=1 Tax=Scyliorhinus torazame TaxID=75743 RepID=A0A401PGA5_SCYTO|nr:hypothetical protein [Scyliorhinus torazame]